MKYQNNMQELLYLEIPTPDTVSVSNWLQTDFMFEMEQKLIKDRKSVV